MPCVGGGSFFLQMVRCGTVAWPLPFVRRLSMTVIAPLASLAGGYVCLLRFRPWWDAIRGRLYIEDRLDAAFGAAWSGTSERVI